jgi:excisionase family DNA binding protein
MAERVTDGVSLLNFNDAARRLCVSPRTIRRQVEAGRLRSVRVGRRHLIRPEALEAFLVASERRSA